MSSADLLSLGVSEPLRTEHDYRVEEIEGTIPPELSGTLYRNGPGRWEDHTGRPLHHLFDGDGMLSAFAIRDGGVHYRNRYVRTRHYLGKTGTTHLGTAAPGGWRANIAKTPPNLANTNVVEHAGRLYALWEGGAPYEIDPDTLDTLGVRHFGGALRKGATFSAHPCVCPRTGDMFNFGAEFIPRPHLRIYRADPQGTVQYLRSVRLPYLAMLHDFAITERYLVFLLSPIATNLLQVALGLKPVGDTLRYRPERGSFFILVPRDGGEVRFIDSPAILQFHLSNAYDDGDDVVVDVITYENPQLLKSISRFQTTPLHDSPGEFNRFRVTKSNRVIREPLSDTVSEFPRHHPDREGRNHRYAYLTSRRRLSSVYDSITKLDLSDNTETTYEAQADGNSFCEPVFVPRPDATTEDDGWLLSVEYQAKEHLSRLVILDAKDLERGPIATAQLTHHIPQGFHGNFVASSS
ncbi:carotenoid oxygenase family protein [Mycobacterium intermedium]|nr:carotenoid oxygenase family protein [Mycobacterium intermedium]